MRRVRPSGSPTPTAADAAAEIAALSLVVCTAVAVVAGACGVSSAGLLEATG